MRREYKQFKMEVTDLIRQYCFDGFTRNEILCLLHSKHSITLSIRRLKNYLRSLNLLTHTSANTVNLAYHAIENEIRGSGSALGYRSMTQRLASTYGIIVPRSVVSALQRELDPRGVEERRRRTFIRRAYINKGPNYLIHIDGYDKLKRYGFPIHGAIDGMDHGTENTLVEDIQKAFRWEHTDDMAGEKSVLKGSSHSNQTVVNKYKPGQRIIIYFTTYWPIKRCLRPTVNGHQIVRPGKDKIVSRIERWWRSLRQWCVQNWISLFAGLENDGLFDTSNLAHLEAAKYCFTELIQNDLNRINTAWNSRSTRPCRVSVTSGKPEMMYFMPELFDAVDYMTPVCMEDLEQVIREYSIGCLAGCSEESRKFFDSVLQQNSLPAISDVNSALQIYAILIRS